MQTKIEIVITQKEADEMIADAVRALPSDGEHHEVDGSMVIAEGILGRAGLTAKDTGWVWKIGKPKDGHIKLVGRPVAPGETILG